MTEVLRVVARLLERAQHKCRKRFAPAARLGHVLHHPLARVRRQLGGERRSELPWRRRCRYIQVGELLQQQLDRVRVRTLMHAVERLAAP